MTHVFMCDRNGSQEMGNRDGMPAAMQRDLTGRIGLYTSRRYIARKENLREE